MVQTIREKFILPILTGQSTLIRLKMESKLQKKLGAYLIIFDDNSKIFLSNLLKNLCCVCSLKSPRRGDSYEHPQHRFL